MPFHRLARLQADLGIPLPASTQWEIVRDLATRLQPMLTELLRQAANGEVVHNDETHMTVLHLPRGEPDDVSPDRTGVFTSGIVATRDGHRIALFVTGRRHAGEHLARVLAERTQDLGPPRAGRRTAGVAAAAALGAREGLAGPSILEPAFEGRLRFTRTPTAE